MNAKRSPDLELLGAPSGPTLAQYLRGFAAKVPVYVANFCEAAVFLLSGLISWLWPIDRLLWPAKTMRRIKLRRNQSCAHATFSELPPARFAKYYDARADRFLEARMQMLALYRPGRRWRPDVRWHGFEHLESALEQKSGAIVWDGNFVYRNLITKMAFDHAGHRFIQLSRRGHGFAATSFGIRFLNPFCRVIEDRFLEQRIEINQDSTLDRLQERLKANKIVNILVWNKARRTLEVPFLTDGLISIATGPVHLSYVSGAPLIPVFTTRGEDGVYDVSVGPALDVPRAADVQPGFQVDYAGIIKSYVDVLEVHVLEHPDQFRGWGTVSWRQAGGSLSSFDRPDSLAHAIGAPSV